MCADVCVEGHLLTDSSQGRIRIGVFALRDIAPSEPLSYDYQFDTMESAAFPCHCGSKNCRGTMAPKALEPKDKSTLTKEERTKLIAAGRLREKRLAENQLENELKRSCVGKHLPGNCDDKTPLGGYHPLTHCL